MRTLTVCTLLCLPALLLAAEFSFKAMLDNYAKQHRNTEEDEAECEILNEEGLEIGPLNAIINRKQLWTDNTLYYEIQDQYTEEQIVKLRVALADMSSKMGGCIKAVASNTATNRVVIKDCGGCSSAIGMVGGKQSMCLARGCFGRQGGTIQHEFLHAFGFHHEHKRPDRDDYVYINLENVRPGMEHNFNKLKADRVDLQGIKYDYASVMHYSAFAFAVDRDIPTIIPLDPNAPDIGRYNISPFDVERVQLLYRCKKAADSVYFKHLAHLY